MRFRARGISQFDGPVGERFPLPDNSEAALKQVEDWLQEIARLTMKGLRAKHLAVLRSRLDEAGLKNACVSTFVNADAGGVPGEWVLAPDADPNRRILYIHGGGMFACSSKSHRSITDRMSAVSNAAVLAIDYRLMPKWSRGAAISDCKAAYRWLLDYSPGGQTDADFIAIAGDSSGGNLALVLSHWVRDSDLRKPDAVVALSPMTDMLSTSPTIKLNLHSDMQVGPAAEKMLRAPKPLLWCLEWLIYRRMPSDPVASPVYADLFDLPPTLLHASESEVLLGDARRYVNKAIAAGSPVQLQTWDDMPHVWHLYPELESTVQAWNEIGKFISGLGNGPRASVA